MEKSNNMNHSDLINGIFELLAILFICNNIRTLYKDKLVKGVSVISIIFFTAWGYWNMFFYPANGLTFSFWAGCGVAITNTTWVLQMAYYKHIELKHLKDKDN